MSTPSTNSSALWTTTTRWLVPDEVVECTLQHASGQPLTYGEILEFWRSSAAFRSQFNALLASLPLTAFRWETPPLTRATAAQPFACVLTHWPRFARRASDTQTYRSYFQAARPEESIVVFPTLGKDAWLVVPVPQGPAEAYGHLAAFVRQAPAAQIDALWRTLGDAIALHISDRPLWINTAGGGVAWLHVRLDTRPKYYVHAPYQQWS